MLLLILWGGIFAFLIYHFGIKPMSYWKKRGVIQGNPVWFVGDNVGTLLRTESFTEMLQRVYTRFKNVRYSGMYQTTIPTLVIHDPELIKSITVKDYEYFLDHRSFVPESDPLFSKVLFVLKGQRWREMRPVISPSFTSSKMKSMFVIMCETLENFINHFSEKNQDVVDVELKDIFTRLGNDIIASIAFGIKVDSLAEPNNEFYLMGKDATNFNTFWKSMKFLGFSMCPGLLKALNISFLGKDVSQFFFDIVDQSIKMREEQNIVRPDMIQLLLEARKGKERQEENGVTVDTGFATVQEATIEKGNNTKPIEITNMDIAAQAMIFFFGGFDAATTLMCFIVYELGINPDIQDRLRKEVEKTNTACDGQLTYEALMRMKYLDMVVSETLRKWPNAAGSDRVCTKPYTIQPVTPEEKPLHIDVGTVLMIPIFGIHRDPEYYPNPEKFDPERFSDENKYKIDPYTYLPFGLGPRNCIGSRFALLEVKTLVYYLLLNFEVVPTKDTVIPPVIAKKSLNLTLEGGFKIGLKRIKS